MTKSATKTLCRLKSGRDYKLQKQLAAEDSHRDAHKFVYRHKNLILGASIEEIDNAVQKIANALRELRLAKLEAEITRRSAVIELAAIDAAVKGE